MWTRPYGTTGKDVSVIGFGAMRFADPQNIDACAEVALHAYRRGINYFDTAPLYCDDKSQTIIGTAIRHMTPGTFYLSTKCGKADGGEFRADLERSLKLLGVGKVHFLHVWCVLTLEDWRKRVEGGAVRAALKARDEGLTEHVVVSSHLPGHELAQVLEEAPFEGVTLGYCALNFPYRREAVRAAGRKKLGVVAMNPLGGGVIPQQAEKLRFLQGPQDASVVEAALRFVVSEPDITCALVGFTTKDHVDQAVRAVEGFRPYGQDRIEAISKHILGSFQGLCTGCGYCLPCPEGVPVPRFMDAYNLKLLADASPKELSERLRWHWGTDFDGAEACSLCGACEERCTQHLPIRDHLKEIAEIGKAYKEKQG